jgi:hypothetical protein
LAICRVVSRPAARFPAAVLGLNRRRRRTFRFAFDSGDLGGAVLKSGALESGIGGVHWSTILAGDARCGLRGISPSRSWIAAIKKKEARGFGVYTAVMGVLVL